MGNIASHRLLDRQSRPDNAGLRSHDGSKVTRMTSLYPATPVASLPEELLVETFFLAIVESNGHGKMFKTISHVCKTWRHICMNSALLCSRSLDVASDPRHRLIDMMERCRKIPVCIQAEFGPCVGGVSARSLEAYERGLENLCFVANDAPLLGALDIQAPPGLYMANFSSINLAKSGGSSLHTLSLQCIPALWEALPPLPEALRRVFPRLCHLSLRCFNIDQSSPFLSPTLTHLEVVDLPVELTVAELLELLSKTPMLRQLRLEGVLDASDKLDADAEQTLSTLRLPYLENLQLEATLKHATFLLQCLDAPEKLKVGFKILAYKFQNEAETFELFIATLKHSPFVRSLPSTLSHCATISRTVFRARYGDTLNLEVCWPGQGPWTALSNLLTKLYDALPLVGAVTIGIHLDVDIFLLQEEWDAILECADAVVHLHLTSPAQKAFRACMLHPTANARARRMNPALLPCDTVRRAFPFLQVLRLAKLDLSGSDTAPEGAAFNLLQFLGHQKARGAKVPRLEMHECKGVTEEKLEVLAKAVGELHLG